MDRIKRYKNFNRIFTLAYIRNIGASYIENNKKEDGEKIFKYMENILKLSDIHLSKCKKPNTKEYKRLEQRIISFGKDLDIDGTQMHYAQIISFCIFLMEDYFMNKELYELLEKTLNYYTDSEDVPFEVFNQAKEMYLNVPKLRKR